MTEPTIPSWSSMKDYYKQSRSVLFPTPSSFQKRDPRIDSSRAKAADAIEDPGLKEEIKTDAHNTRRDNPRFNNSLLFPNRNPVPQPQPERKDIPVNREKYEDDQYEEMSTVDDMYNNDNLREYLAGGPNGPSGDLSEIEQILHQLREYYARNSAVASEGRYKTNDILDLPHYGGSEDQQAMIQPGRR